MTDTISTPVELPAGVHTSSILIKVAGFVIRTLEDVGPDDAYDDLNAALRAAEWGLPVEVHFSNPEVFLKACDHLGEVPNLTIRLMAA